MSEYIQQIVEFITNFGSITKVAKPLNSGYLLVAPRSGKKSAFKKRDRPRSRPRVPDPILSYCAKVEARAKNFFLEA